MKKLKYFPRKNILNLLLIFLLFSCGQSELKNNNNPINNNKSTPISCDKKKLGKLINLKKFDPIKVKFKHINLHNLAKKSRFSVFIPSGSYLEAILYFDSETYNKLLNSALLISQISTNHKSDYQFDWLDRKTKIEIEKIDSTQNDIPPYIFEKGVLRNGGYFNLPNNKLLLKLSSD